MGKAKPADMVVTLEGLVSAVEWQCAHSAALETWHGGDTEPHVYEFEGPDGERLALEAWRSGVTVTVRPASHIL